jgi:HAD superfamily, subfamily IIIB (Acid phosphatase)
MQVIVKLTRGLTLGILVSFVTACATAPTRAPASFPNLGEFKTTLVQYHESGAYLRDLAAVDVQAERYILQRGAGLNHAAVVLDIDETSLSNWREIIADDFGYIHDGQCEDLPKGPCGSHAWELMGHADAIAPTLHLFQAARKANIAVFFITGRDGSEQAATEKNLNEVGFTGWTKVILRPSGSRTASAADFKAPERAKIEAQGYIIIANIGDQPSDLAGGHAERAFLLPNPFYRIP